MGQKALANACQNITNRQKNSIATVSSEMSNCAPRFTDIVHNRVLKFSNTSLSYTVGHFGLFYWLDRVWHLNLAHVKEQEVFCGMHVD